MVSCPESPHPGSRHVLTVGLIPGPPSVPSLKDVSNVPELQDQKWVLGHSVS